MTDRRTTVARTALGLAAGALALGSLAGCSLGPFGTDSSASTPVDHSSHAARTPRPTPSPTPSPTPVVSTSAPASPSTQPSPTSPPSTVPTPAEHVTTYRHLVVKLPVSDSAVPGAPAGFTDFLRSALEADLAKLGGGQGCERAASIQVQRISSLGYAMVARNIDPAIPTCVKAASYAGGYQAILGEKDGTWSQLVGLQDEPACATMSRLGVPQSIYGKCV